MVPDVSAIEIEDSYSYLVPDDMQLSRGDAVLVPFGSRTVVGFVLGVESHDPGEFEFKLRPIKQKVAGISLPESILSLLDFVESEFVSTAGSAIAAAMPPGIRTRLTTSYILGTGEATSPQQRAIVDAISVRGKSSESALRPFAASALKALVARGSVIKVVGIPAERTVGPKEICLSNEHAARAFIAAESSAKPAQSECLAALLAAPKVGLTIAETAVLAGVSEATVRTLMDARLLTPVARQNPGTLTSGHTLNRDQATAVERICQALRSQLTSKFLLFGITGSGKTEVYLRAIAETLSLGKQALYLVPEIALTAQVVGLLRARFGSAVTVMHSGLATGERLRNWRRAASGDAPVVVGARSAIFAPLDNLGLIVIDEEHDVSYKQESTPRYDVRALAELRAERAGAVLISGSATPSISTYYRASEGDFELLQLPVRAAAESLPKVWTEDLREAYKSRSPSMLSARLREELVATHARNEQAIMFINRRAFARSLLCRDCGSSPQCPSCSVSLTFHSRPPSLRCHHCDHREKVEDRCRSCGSLRIRPLGIGTQKVEEYLKREFPSMNVERMDRDVASRKGALEEVFGRVRSGETDVLVGTQMIAKGLDFENVTLVGVIAADIGLTIPDYRSAERTFQLLTQVAGRSGRKKPGSVIVQSFAPEHSSIRFAADHDYVGFYAAEIRERRDANYPPFVRIVNIVVSGADREAVSNAAATVRGTLNQRLGKTVVIYGPAECALARLHGNWRSHLLLKLPRDFPMATFPRAKELGIARPLFVTVDVDPSTLM